MARFAAAGAGRMGRGLAITFAWAGHRIALIDLRPRTPEAAARLKQSIDDALTRLPVPVDSGLDLGALIARMGPARTLHSLLGARPDTRQFRHHAANPLDVDVLIVDEASMVHLEMMDALLQALPPTARLVSAINCGPAGQAGLVIVMSIDTCWPRRKAAAEPKKIAQQKPTAAISVVHVAGCALT